VIFWYFGKIVLCYKVFNFFWWYSFCSIITKVLPLSALVTIKLCSLIFFFMFVMIFLSIVPHVHIVALMVLFLTYCYSATGCIPLP
jgi:hypothetical protein